MEAMRVPDKYISVERGETPLADPDEVVIIEVAQPFETEGEPLRVRVDTVPGETIATSPDDVAAKATALQRLSKAHDNRWGFKVEYFA